MKTPHSAKPRSVAGPAVASARDADGLRKVDRLPAAGDAPDPATAASKTDAKTQVFTYTYDSRGNRTAKVFADGTEAEPVWQKLAGADPRNPRRFFQRLGELVIDRMIEILAGAIRFFS